jgi:hypothetical protein
VYLDLPEIDALFLLFPYKKVKSACQEYLVPQKNIIIHNYILLNY